MTNHLTQQQIASYQQDGYLVVRGLFSRPELERLEGGVMRAVHRCVDPAYPAPAHQYTITGQDQTDPDLLFIAEHPDIVPRARQLLGGEIVLSAFVAYLKTPGAGGTRGDYEGSHTTGHNDYKTYHQAGSSLNWLFAIVPLRDLDQVTGPLLVSPGSHRLTQLQDPSRGVRRVQRSRASSLHGFVDAELRRGDLLFMHGFTWHEGGANRSDHDRLGVYNKYRSANAPPAAGPDLFCEEAWLALSPGRGRDLLPHHSDIGVTDARLLTSQGDRFLIVPGAPGWGLPGAEVAQPREMARATVLLERTQQELARRYDIRIDWMSFVGDYGTQTLHRVYAYSETLAKEPTQGRWATLQELEAMAAAGQLNHPWVLQAAHEWLTPRLRGIGQTMGAAKSARA